MTSWIIFNLFVVAAIILDLGVFSRKYHVIGYKESLLKSAFWIALALIFCGWVYYTRGADDSLKFLTGYVIELSLSIDNLFVFISIFTYFAVEKQYIHRVLFWGVLGAIILRACFIFAGVVLLHYFHWAVYVFGVVLIYAGIKMALSDKQGAHPDKNRILEFIRKWIPLTKKYHQESFFINENGRYKATPLFAVLLVIEASDVLFAIDSVPAILAITTDPFLVYSSNVFALLGLRSMYFALEAMLPMFHYLSSGISAILVFVGLKMILSDVMPIPIPVALSVIISILSFSIGLSLLRPKN